MSSTSTVVNDSPAAFSFEGKGAKTDDEGSPFMLSSPHLSPGGGKPGAAKIDFRSQPRGYWRENFDTFATFIIVSLGKEREK